jgi:Grx4 family monothiol glutaredoxin
MTAINEWIDNEVKTNDVVVFMKGTPAFPQCGFSGQVVQILDYLGVDYKGVNVLSSDDLRQGIKEYSQWPTIPQLYVKASSSAAATSFARCSRPASCRPISARRAWPRQPPQQRTADPATPHVLK